MLAEGVLLVQHKYTYTKAGLHGMRCNVMALIMDSMLELQAENAFAAIRLGRRRLTITLTSCEIVARTHKMYNITNEQKMLAASRLHNSVGGTILILQFNDILRHPKKKRNCNKVLLHFGREAK